MNKSNHQNSLPPGQKERDDFPRFGLPAYADRISGELGPSSLSIGGEIEHPFKITNQELVVLKKAEQTSDFHCVTTWSKCDLTWGGYRFSEFYDLLIKPKLKLAESIEWVIFKSLDGYRARMCLADLLKDDVMLADKLNGQKLCKAHGAPLRLVVPKHYGYKNPKHLKAIEFHGNNYQFKPPLLSFMEHPRGRVVLEERGKFFPGWLLRYLYRPMIEKTISAFK